MVAIKLFDPAHPRPENVTVDTVIDAYLAQKTAEHDLGSFKAKSLEKLRHYLPIFADEHGKRMVSDCRQADLTKWLVAHPEWQSSYTRADASGSVVAAFRWADQEGLCRNPFRRPKYVGPPPNHRPAIAPEEYHAIMKFARIGRTKGGRRRCRTGLPFRAALLFLWRTGARTIEMRDCRWEQLDWDKAIIVMPGKSSQATGEMRVIPVRRLIPLLRWLWAKRSPKQQHIFTNSIGRPWTCDRFAKEFRRFARMAGVRDEISGYCCRHGMTVRLLDAGVGERQIADALGWKTTKFVAHYGRTCRTKADYLNDVLDRDGKK